MTNVVAFVVGVVFALGLGLGGMTQPARVLGFLDATGAWDPSLALVMAGAVAVYGVTFPFVMRRGRPVFGAAFGVPTRRDVDARLVGGAVIFGVGWGLAGLCPGPALVALASGAPRVVLFVAAMLLGMAVQRWSDRVVATRRTHDALAVAAPEHSTGGA